MVTAWWRVLTSSSYHAHPLRELFETIDPNTLAPSDIQIADDLGDAAASFSPELAAYRIGLAYTSMLPREHRAAHGIYYTPPTLAKRLIDQATVAGVDWTSARILDPACGGGAFLAPVAYRTIEELRSCSPRILVENIATRLRGYEIDPFGAWLSQVTLDAVLLPVTCEAKKRLPIVIAVGDSLRNNSVHESFDLVIGNSSLRAHSARSTHSKDLSAQPIRACEPVRLVYRLGAEESKAGRHHCLCYSYKLPCRRVLQEFQRTAGSRSSARKYRLHCLTQGSIRKRPARDAACHLSSWGSTHQGKCVRDQSFER